MPRFDGTGPEGKGPLTGRKMGNCDGLPEKRGLGFFRFGIRNNRNSPRRANFLNNNN
ncbi:MAG: DUF5320 domain-containing protein [Candidatus Nanoarchaeia archaeon]|nr:DUF5320 domain-containing protein [Candidatus Nanoarchaeia archaeon]